MLIPSPEIILTGMFMGVMASAPVGPVNLLCIQRTIERGFFAGFAAGLGAVLGDGLIALGAAFGINAISDLILKYDKILRIAGGIVLIAFGIHLFVASASLSRSDAGRKDASRDGIMSYIWSVPQTFFLTITNPGAWIAMAGLVGGGGAAIGGLNTSAEALTLVVAVMGGSVLWWFLIARMISLIRHKLDAATLHLINQIAGGSLIVFGAAVLGQLGLKTLGWI